MSQYGPGCKRSPAFYYVFGWSVVAILSPTPPWFTPFLSSLAVSLSQIWIWVSITKRLVRKSFYNSLLRFSLVWTYIHSISISCTTLLYYKLTRATSLENFVVLSMFWWQMVNNTINHHAQWCLTPVNWCHLLRYFLIIFPQNFLSWGHLIALDSYLHFFIVVYYIIFLLSQILKHKFCTLHK